MDKVIRLISKKRNRNINTMLSVFQQRIGFLLLFQFLLILLVNSRSLRFWCTWILFFLFDTIVVLFIYSRRVCDMSYSVVIFNQAYSNKLKFFFCLFPIALINARATLCFGFMICLYLKQKKHMFFK